MSQAAETLVPSGFTSARGTLTVCIKDRAGSDTQMMPSHTATSTRSPCSLVHEMSSVHSQRRVCLGRSSSKRQADAHTVEPEAGSIHR
eukprot:scaffold15612_cov75-Phaeocystis_antarctica.AAC.6